MLAPSANSVSEPQIHQAPQRDELEFYQSYGWCLNPHITVQEAIVHLGEELDKLGTISVGWQVSEVATNIYLLSCGLLNCVDGYLRGRVIRLPRLVVTNAVGRTATRLLKAVPNKSSSKRRVARWRKHWLSELNHFFELVFCKQPIDPELVAKSAPSLRALLQLALPVEILTSQLGIPSPFAHLDLTPSDILKLGNCFIERFPDRAQPILLMGVRTSGSYFAPLLRAMLESNGYRNVELLTIDPNKGVGRHEGREINRFAAIGYRALIIDDPPNTGRTIFAAFDIVRRAGFAPDNITFVVPTHSSNPKWLGTLADNMVVTFPPQQWHKKELLEPKMAELRLAEYLRDRNFTSIRVTTGCRAARINARLRGNGAEQRGEPLKRVFEVRLQTAEGEIQTRYVLAKSVGWGWLGYQTFLAGNRLSGHVPSVLGLRDGILYMEWIPQSEAISHINRRELLDASARYVAARARHLRLPESAARMDLKRYDNGTRLLEKALGRAYSRFLPVQSMRARIGSSAWPRCPAPTLIDGNMRQHEWISGPGKPLKTDYEHHGMGKCALNLIDPAYDLADTILNLELSLEEETRLIREYIAESEDTTVEQRLFMHKLLAGVWTMNRTQEQLFDSPRSAVAQQDLHRNFMKAWNFLTVHAARHCGSLCYKPADPHWRAPLVFVDIDGVIDRRLFGFPCTTAAGIQAISLLNAHDMSVALNTARSAVEVKEYCSAYGLAGGVAEYGSYLWDAVRGRERVLISSEAQRQLAKLRTHLQCIPGVFLDDRYQYSIRAFAYRDQPRSLMQSLIRSLRTCPVGDGALIPLSSYVVQQLILDMGLDLLSLHQTTIDTTVVSNEVDKGTGLAVLREWVLQRDAETIAVGDQSADLPMFRAATRSFAPANVGCRDRALLLGCEVASRSFQQGLLDIVRKIVHRDGDACERSLTSQQSLDCSDDIFLSVLRAADQKSAAHLFKALVSPTILRSAFH